MDSETIINRLKKQNENLRLKLKESQEKEDRFKLFFNNLCCENISKTDQENIYRCKYSAYVSADTVNEVVAFVGSVCDTPMDDLDINELLNDE